MKIENGKLVFERTKCSGCSGTGTIQPRKRCPKYGHRMRGKPCPHCGSTRKDNHGYIEDGPRITCTKCDGSLLEDEDRFSYLPWATVIAAVPVVVQRSNRRASFNEEYIGYGIIQGCVDYGKSAKMTDEELIASVKDTDRTSSTQGAHISDKSGRVCDRIVVACHDNGYSLVAAFDEAGS
jgi:hypothetical protein